MRKYSDVIFMRITREAALLERIFNDFHNIYLSKAWKPNKYEKYNKY